MTEKEYGPALSVSKDIRCCSRCKSAKPLENFHKDSKNRLGKSCRCKDCAKEVTKAWRELNPLKDRERVRELFLKNREKYANSHNDRQLLVRYGLTRLQYNSLLEATGGQCPLCDRVFGIKAYTKPVVDHCHKSGKTRGIICRQCNLGLGAFRDQTASLLRAIEYLEENNGN